MKPLVALLSSIALLPLGAALGADFDGSKLLMCAAAEARDCVSGEPCRSGRPADYALPTFMRVDIQKMIIAGPQRTTAAQFVLKDARQILMGGTELGYAWTFALDADSGAMTASITDRQGAFVLFGSCTPL